MKTQQTMKVKYEVRQRYAKRTAFMIFALMTALSLLLTACGGGVAAGAGTAGDSGGGAAAANDAGGSGDAGGGGGDVPTLIWFMGNPGQVPSDQAMVEDKLNEISVAKIGAKVKTIFMSSDEVMLAMSAGENWDKTFTCEWYNNYASQALAGYFYDITEMLPTLTPALWNDMPEVVWEGAKINGKIMAVPVKKDYAAELYWRFDRDLFDSLDMKVPPTMSFFDVEPYMAAAKQAWKDGNPKAKVEYPLMLNRSGFGGILSVYDMINHEAMIGIPYSAIGTPDEDKVVLTIQHPEALARLEVIHKWFKAGYINPDAMTTDGESTLFAVRSGQGFYGADAIWSSGSGFPNAISKYSGPYLSTSSVRGSMNAINARSKNAEKTLKLMELISSDREYRDILRYGVEGVHWTRQPDGLVKKTQAGLDGYTVWAFSQGSYSGSSVEAAEGVEVDPDMWKVIFDSYDKEAKATKSIGFAFDPSSIEVELAAVAAARSKYWDGISTGTLDPAVTIPQMMKELESAGIFKVLEECQKQYDAFLAAK